MLDPIVGVRHQGSELGEGKVGNGGLLGVNVFVSLVAPLWVEIGQHNGDDPQLIDVPMGSTTGGEMFNLQQTINSSVAIAPTDDGCNHHQRNLDCCDTAITSAVVLNSGDKLQSFQLTRAKSILGI